jgi:predicted O-linked N-acetylglucosamine transferase (SPINDLY family)
MTIADALRLGVEHHQAGRIPQAEALCRQILEVEPNHPEALHLLGLLAHQGGQHEVAVTYISKALALEPANPELHNNIGEAYRAQGKLQEAITHYWQALSLHPTYAEAYNNLGNVLKVQGALDDAQAHYGKALELRPAYAEAHNNLATVLQEQGKREEAIVHYRRALQLNPKFAAAHNNLGALLQEQGKLEEAVACYRQALVLQPSYAEAHSNLASAFQVLGKLDEAKGHIERALALNPTLVEAYYTLGNVLKAEGDLPTAVARYQQVLTLRPDYADAYNNMALALQAQGNLEDAVAHYRKALAIRPAFADAHSNLGTVLMEQGKLDGAIEQYQRALALRPDHAAAHSNVLFCLHYHPAYDPSAIFAEHQAWNARHARPLAAERQQHGHRRDPDRPLRLGYVSADFRRHPVGYFLEPVLLAHDRTAFQVFCYSMVLRGDDITTRVQAHADVWRPILALSDADVVRLIREDHIDILVDLSGHTAGNRLLVFARKAAPVQVTWIGYFNTTGLETMDYLLSDPFLSPPDVAQTFTEDLIRLPEGYVCYRPPDYAPPVSASPVLTRGYPTLGCFNNLSKVNRRVIAMWSQILHGVPQARLILQAKALLDPPTRQAFVEQFLEHGISPDRIALRGSSSHAEYLAAYGEVDLALDPFPFAGGLTTCEALWMGVPVLTLAGCTLVSRMGVSHLARVGLPELIARSPKEYVEVSLALIREPGRLAQLRAALRPRMAASSLCDARTFTRHLEIAYRMMWERYLQGLSPRADRGPATACGALSH